MLARSRILIVDSSADNRVVLSTMLERRGAETLQTARIRHACRLVQSERLDAILIDGEDRKPSASDVLGDLGRCASLSSTPIVVLGTQTRHISPLKTGHFVSKPYHYAALIRRIEELLGNRA